MSNVFSQHDNSKPDINRQNFDLSFQNNLTMKFGALYPVMCKPVTPHDSFEITPELMLRLQPMVYPCQSKIYANMHFFYVRNRTLWKDWKDFEFNTKDGLIPPYIKQVAGSPFFENHTLADYLNIPNSKNANQIPYTAEFPIGYSNADNPVDCNLVNLGENAPGHSLRFYTRGTQFAQSKYLNGVNYDYSGKEIIAIPTSVAQSFFQGTMSLNELLYAARTRNVFSIDSSDYSDVILGQILPINLKDIQFTASAGNENLLFDTKRFNFSLPLTDPIEEPYHMYLLCGNSLDSLRVKHFQEVYVNVSTTEDVQIKIGSITYDPAQVVGLNAAISGLGSEDRYIIPIIVSPVAGANDVFVRWTDSAHNGYIFSSFIGTLSMPFLDTPFNYAHLPFSYDAGTDSIPCPVSALPFRAYEAIYNSFYRNQQNEPFMVNGVAEYNKWIPTDEGGADDYFYGLHYRCYEPDFLTSALPSPQQGLAPLVGVNAQGTFTFEDAGGTTYTLTPTIGSDGETLTGISYYDSGLPNGTLQTMMHLISQGISINDFRNVNSFQRWLEKNIRKGYRYKDLIEGRYGTNVRYNELDMPEFLGGISDIIKVTPVVNQSEGENLSSLGSLAGLGSVYSNGHPISVHCDEAGFIIGILSISPVPAYDMLLPKFFTYSTPLDYYSPEFAKIGMQPIPYKEVSPILKFNEMQDNPNAGLNDTFGYNRAWYDLVASTDEVHGDFRDTMRDYVLQRDFIASPVLGSEFLDIHAEGLNDVFSDIDDDDKIIGAVNFKINKKSIVPRYIIPGLE